jgi:hypothetical protein
MTNKDYDLHVEWDGLEFRLLPRKAESIINTLYLTGQKIEFILSVRNISDKTKWGKLPILVRYGVGLGHPADVRIFELKSIEPHGSAAFPLKLVNKIEGNALITIPILGTTESLLDLPDEVIKSRAQNVEYQVIYSLHIMDRGLYVQQQKRDEILIKKLDALPKIILHEVDRRLNLTKNDIMDEVEKQLQKQHSNDQTDNNKVKTRKPYYLGWADEKP